MNPVHDAHSFSPLTMSSDPENNRQPFDFLFGIVAPVSCVRNTYACKSIPYAFAGNPAEL